MTLAELLQQWLDEMNVPGVHTTWVGVSQDVGRLVELVEAETKKQAKAAGALWDVGPTSTLTERDLSTGATGKALPGGGGIGTLVFVAAVLGGGWLLLRKKRKK